MAYFTHQISTEVSIKLLADIEYMCNVYME